MRSSCIPLHACTQAHPYIHGCTQACMVVHKPVWLYTSLHVQASVGVEALGFKVRPRARAGGAVCEQEELCASRSCPNKAQMY